MIEPRFRWIFPERESAILDKTTVGPRLGGLLAARGVTSESEIAAWFADPHEGLHDPAALPDADQVLLRLRAARAAGERVQVFGDFDADGLTGLAIMVIALRRFGLLVDPYVPSRLDEGHGLSFGALDAAGSAGATVIVTVDCGSTSVVEIEAAAARGIDVIVTDHHRLPADLPPAFALVNPHRLDSVYPDSRLAGSGVAFKIAQLVLADEPGGPAVALGLADLATIGTVADVAPIIGENRSIARLGLDILRATPRPGVAALLERARTTAARIDLETVSFAIAPRLNAAGRVGEAMQAAELLLADDPADAAALADALESANLTRRDLMQAAVADARALVADHDPLEPVTIVRGPWSVGIVGLVAARLVDERGRPAVVGADVGDVIRASCRSDGSLDLGATLDACGDLFVRHGGHAGAAGFEIRADRWDEFGTRFSALAAGATPPDPRRSVSIDLAVPAIDVDYGLYRELSGLAPCGPGNPDPLVAVLGLTVTRVRAASGGHSQMTLRRDRDVLDGIAFGRSDLAETVHEGDRVDVVARLMSRSFGGFESLQLDIRDVADSGSHPAAAAILDGSALLAAPVAVGTTR